MKRQLFNIITCLSLLFSLATSVMWVRSYFVGETFGVFCDVHVRKSPKAPAGTVFAPFCDSRIIELQSDRGGIDIGSSVSDVGDIKPWKIIRWGHEGPWPRARVWSFAAEHLSGRLCVSLETIYPVPFVVTLALPAAWLVVARRRWQLQRESPGCPCTQCGYDLRASPVRCPECGTGAKVVQN